MKTIQITYKSNISTKVPCKECKETDDQYLIVIDKKDVKSIKESPSMPGIEGVRVD